MARNDIARLQRTLEMALGVSLLVTGGCGGSHSSSATVDPATTTSAALPDAPGNPGGTCAVVGQPSSFGDIDVRDFDFAEERLFGVAGTAGASVGFACKTAHDMSACKSQLAMLAPAGTFPIPSEDGDKTYVAYTHGDEVGAITTGADFSRVLGAIDTPARASVLLGLMHHTVACDALRVGDGGYYFTERIDACDGTTQQLVRVYHLAANGTLSLDSVTMQPDPTGNSDGVCGAGRMTDGVSLGAVDSASAGAHLARMAATEAASVLAFVDLKRELRVHGAPQGLVDLTRRAAREEAHHARAMRRHALRHGGRVPSIRRRVSTRRSLIDIACENVREGCVGEAFGALMLHHQGQTCTDRKLADDLIRIAREEASHALLSLQIDSWIRSRLNDRDRARVDDARDEALASLEKQATSSEPTPHDIVLGLPSRRAHLRMVETIARAYR